MAAATEVDMVVAIAELTVAVTTEEDILADSLAEALTVAGTGPGERVLRGLGLGKDAVAPATLRRAGMAFTVAHPHDLPELMPVGERAASRP